MYTLITYLKYYFVTYHAMMWFKRGPWILPGEKGFAGLNVMLLNKQLVACDVNKINNSFLLAKQLFT
jgi:hypothetical protein